MNLNSHELQRTISSESLERCVIIRERSKSASAAKSLSDTPSMLLIETDEKPSSPASATLSVG